MKFKNLQISILSLILGFSVLASTAHAEMDVLITVDNKHQLVKIEGFAHKTLIFPRLVWIEMEEDSKAFNALMLLKRPKTDGQLQAETSDWLDKSERQWSDPDKRDFNGFLLFKNALYFMEKHGLSVSPG